ncbi:MAG: hypothetical protein LUG21_05015, partial [Clostridiales bacterium]|nr:hypothetical protein [Clostridiales bacterium]
MEEKGILPILTDEEDTSLWEGLKVIREQYLTKQKQEGINFKMELMEYNLKNLQKAISKLNN